MTRRTFVTISFLIVSLVPGSSGLRADTFNIEIDYMVGGTPSHSHKPSDAEIAAVVQMFACQGHTLNIILSNPLPHTDNLIYDPNNANSFFGYDSGSFNSFGHYRSIYFDHAGQSGWHYCIFGHNYNGSGSSGLAEQPGGNLLVSLGSFSSQVGTPFDRAASLAHEFGHNLGLTHCGNMNCPNSGGGVGFFTPIVPSIMTYFFQLQGVRTNLLCQGLTIPDAALFKEIDYSHGTMCSQNESSLSETFGSGMTSVDWNCDGFVNPISNVAQVIRGGVGGWCGATGTKFVLSDYDEWSNISDVTLTRSAERITDAPLATCITVDEAVLQTRNACAQPSVSSEACITARMIYLRATANPTPTGTCSSPYPNVTSVLAGSPTSGSVLFFAGGTYNEPGVVTITTPMTLFSVGGTTTIQH